ncbi:MotA/TolQ/ExbB proton channel family protein [Fulvivirga sp. M361]|uniref:MotA/TolQ/ExbB proton channel family protein n=1 Tax=Fulvivirga sp. M361 TaxID=2594266 RepID=UPI00117A8F6F|nr:MotA/TolQ/ExbB proton channel family protein [Fulvivirga sp. M361]TRX51412.1 MotA/TolQ/ExbB proton channel family protein [Fulvivirga sp. M361]
MILTQITTAAQDTTDVVTSPDSVRVIDLLFQGGFMMIPILVLSIVAIYIFVERVRTINAASKTPDQFMSQIRQQVEKGDVDGARMTCQQHDSPVARMIEKGVARIGSPLKNIEVSIENVGKIEIFKLEKNLSLLATISGAAPMLGFLGTVIGMIQAFISIAQEEGSVSPKLLSEGIYTAMVTTAAGLFVGILAYLGYNYLVTRVQKVIHKMEYNSIDFIDLLQEPR